MRSVARVFAPAWRVFNIDLPGHGHSPLPPEPWGVPDFADLVCRFIRRYDLGSVTFVGHSNGGRIALYIASDPDLHAVVQHLVLISPSGIRPRRTAAYHARRTIATLMKAPFLWLPEPFRTRTLAWLRRTIVWKALGSSDYRALEGVMRATFVRTVNCYLDERVSRIRVPLLVLRGAHDEAVSDRQVRTLVERVPGASLVTLREAGHYGYLDNPNDFATAALGFLEQQASGPSRPETDATDSLERQTSARS